MPNEATNFRESLSENFTDIVIGQGHFTETVRFFPNDSSKPPRDVTAVVTRKVKRRDQKQGFKTADSLVRILFQRSATLGVVNLVEGDAVRLETDTDDCDRWVHHETVAESVNSVTALFMKSTVTEFGNLTGNQL